MSHSNYRKKEPSLWDRVRDAVDWAGRTWQEGAKRLGRELNELGDFVDSVADKYEELKEELEDTSINISPPTHNDPNEEPWAKDLNNGPNDDPSEEPDAKLLDRETKDCDLEEDPEVTALEKEDEEPEAEDPAENPDEDFEEEPALDDPPEL